MADHTEQIVDFQHRATRRMEQLLAAEQCRNPRAFGHFQFTQGRADAPFFGAQAVDEQLPLAGDVHFQGCAGDRRRVRRYGHFQQLGHPRQAGALHQQRHQHDKERQVEVQLRMGQAGHQREHRENDRHRAAQADPGDKAFFAAMEGLEWQQADHHRQRPRKQDHPQRQAQGRQGDRQQVMGRDQKAQHQEHADLCEPGHAVEHMQNAMTAAHRAIADHQAAQVHGEEAAAVQGVGQGEDEQTAGDHQDRIQAGGQVDAVDHLQHQPAAAQANHAADAEFAHQMGQQAPVQAGLAAGEHVDQGDGEKHRHWVVAAGFDFQGGGNPFVQALAAEQREHRRGVGGADNRANQQALNNIEVKQPGCRHAGEAGGNQHPHCGQGQRRPECHAETRHPRAQATVEQDHGQCEVAHQVGGRVVVENDAAAIDAGDHAHGQDDHQDRDPQARRKRTHQNARTHQQRADQEQAVDGRRIQRQYSISKQDGTQTDHAVCVPGILTC
ncbi:hypothetical protein PS687_02103 [Pseudomonas fluorescens]|nr:hypothetical protein PS687_02103 [Pseudomonas fluorescens]